MTRPEKIKLKEALAESGRFSISVNGTVISIERRGKRLEISVKENGSGDSQWLYRDTTIAIDRFAEQVSHYRRKK